MKNKLSKAALKEIEKVSDKLQEVSQENDNRFLEIQALTKNVKELEKNYISAINGRKEFRKLYKESREMVRELKYFAIWMTGCGYDFMQHEYFIKQRDKLLKK